LIFNAQILAPPDGNAVRCNSAETILLVYDVTVDQRADKFILVNLIDHTFARVFIPNALYQYTFKQVSDRYFMMEPPGSNDIPPYNRSFIIDGLSLKWSGYQRQGGFDTVAIPMSDWHASAQNKDVGWQIVWDKIYRIALMATTPMKAQIVTDRVVKRIEPIKTLDPPVDLSSLVQEECKKLAEGESDGGAAGREESGGGAVDGSG
jgi:hypothetical protein